MVYYDEVMSPQHSLRATFSFTSETRRDFLHILAKEKHIVEKDLFWPAPHLLYTSILNRNDETSLIVYFKILFICFIPH